MFEKKQIIYSETQGVCQVENIGFALRITQGAKNSVLCAAPGIRQIQSILYSGRKPSGKTAGVVYQGRGRGTSGNGRNEKR